MVYLDGPDVVQIAGGYVLPQVPLFTQIKELFYIQGPSGLHVGTSVILPLIFVYQVASS